MEYQQVFILGAPRSGTTFLASLLDKTGYGKPVETHFITKYYKRLDRYGDITRPDRLRRLLTDIWKERPVQQWGITLEFDHFYRSLPEGFDYTDVVNRIMSLQKNGENVTAWGDKTPHYVGDLPILLQLFPNARYIYIVRDGRDVALSLLEKNWGPNNIFECATYWSSLNRHAELMQRLYQQGQLYRLTYEDLIDHTETQVLAIYKFLGEEVSEQEAKALAAPVISRNYGKWRTRMSENDLRTFEAVAGASLVKFGYEVRWPESRISPVRAAAYLAHAKFRRLYFLFYTNVIDGFRIKFLGKAPFNE